MDPSLRKNQILTEKSLGSRFFILKDKAIKDFVKLNKDPIMVDNLNHTQSHLSSKNKENLELNRKSKKVGLKQQTSIDLDYKNIDPNNMSNEAWLTWSSGNS